MPPPLSNVDAWRNLIAQGELDEHRAEAIIAVYDTLTDKDDKVIVTRIELYLERRFTRIILRFIGQRAADWDIYWGPHRDDIYEEARFKVLAALASPTSKAGAGLRRYFWRFITNCVLDAQKKFRRSRDSDDEVSAKIQAEVTAGTFVRNGKTSSYGACFTG